MIRMLKFGGDAARQGSHLLKRILTGGGGSAAWQSLTTPSNCSAAVGPSAPAQSSKNGSSTCAQPRLHVAGRPELQSSEGSSQHSSLSAAVLSARLAHALPPARCCSARPVTGAAITAVVLIAASRSSMASPERISLPAGAQQPRARLAPRAASPHGRAPRVQVLCVLRDEYCRTICTRVRR